MHQSTNYADTASINYGRTLNLAWLSRGDLKFGALHLTISDRLSLSLSSPLWRHFQAETGVCQSAGRVRRRPRHAQVRFLHLFNFGGKEARMCGLPV